MSKIYYDKDGDISFVTDKTIAIIGYGNQGRSQALNMRDSGVKDIAGERRRLSGAVHCGCLKARRYRIHSDTG
jgi:ketol-acid reductoisomerase